MYGSPYLVITYPWYFSVFVYSLIYILPAYAANGAPVLFGGGKPLDFGKKLFGKRIFGNNKTIRGTLAGLVCGVLVGAIVYPLLGWLTLYLLYVAVSLSLGTIFGDLLGSFVKRRMNIKPGASVPLLDQYGFFIFALLFALPLGNQPGLYGLLFLIVLTGVLHVLTNMGANRLKLKKVPW